MSKIEEKKYKIRQSKIVSLIYRLTKRAEGLIFRQNKAIRDYHNLLNILKPLDIILCTNTSNPSNALNFTKLKHAAIFVGFENDVPYIVEVSNNIIIHRPFVEFLSEKDSIVVVRSKKPFKKKSLDKTVDWLKKKHRKKYDLDYQMNVDLKVREFECSELCFWTIKQALLGESDLKLKKKFFGKILSYSPMDFYKDKKNFQIVFKTTE